MINRNPRNLKDHAKNWRELGSLIVNEAPDGIVDGANAVFHLKNPALPDSLVVYKGASTTTVQRLSPAAYTVLFDDTLKRTKITFGVAPAAGSILLCDYRS